MPSIASAPDPFRFIEDIAYVAVGNVGYSNIRGRTELSSIIADPLNTKVVLVDGQSEHATTGGTAPYTTVSANAQQLNVFDGGVYAGADPVLGASDNPNVGLSSVTMRIADRIIANGKATRVIMVPIACGGTSWLSYDPALPRGLFTKFRAAYNRVLAKGLTIDVIIAARGASDNVLGTSQTNVRNAIWAWADGVRTLGCAAPIYLGNFTMATGSVSATVQAGIAAAIDVGRDTRAGYDGDAQLTVGGGYRLADQTHFSDTGLTQCANGWADLIFP